MDEQRPQRQSHSDLNERQEEGVPALEIDTKTGARPDVPGAGAGDASATQPAQAEPAAGKGPVEAMSGGEDKPLTNEAAARADYEDPTTQTNPDTDPAIDATGLVDDVDESATSGGQSSGGDGGK